jgi:hypothetical protein
MNINTKIHIILKHRYLRTINLVSGFLEFCTIFYCAKVSFLKPTVKSGPKGFIQNLVCNFRPSYKFLRILEV